MKNKNNMKNFKFLLLIPTLLITAVIVWFALKGWNRRDQDYAAVMFLAALCFGLVTSCIWKGLNKRQLSDENLSSDEEKPSQSNNGGFHTIFSVVLVVVITCSFIGYKKIKRKVETEECRVYICNELANYDQQYPMYKNPEDLFILKQQSPLDTKYITESIIPNLKLEDAFLDKLNGNLDAFPKRCSTDAHSIRASMSTLIYYTEIWLENILTENTKKIEREKYSNDEDSIFETIEYSILETTEGRNSEAVEEDHYSKKGILDNHNDIKEYRSSLSCK